MLWQSTYFHGHVEGKAELQASRTAERALQCDEPVLLIVQDCALMHHASRARQIIMHHASWLKRNFRQIKFPDINFKYWFTPAGAAVLSCLKFEVRSGEILLSSNKSRTMINEEQVPLLSLTPSAGWTKKPLRPSYARYRLIKVYKNSDALTHHDIVYQRSVSSPHPINHGQHPPCTTSLSSSSRLSHWSCYSYHCLSISELGTHRPCST